MVGSEALYVACPAKRGTGYGHVRDCDAEPGERCNNRMNEHEMLSGLHPERKAAWANLTEQERRAARVVARLRYKETLE